jgi:hypothetical protein
MLYPSFHMAHVQISSLDQFLLFQTMHGAVDIVPGEVMRELENFTDPESSALSEVEIETLKRRGYLTELSAEQEQEQARIILRVLSEKLQPSVDLTLRLPQNGEPSSSLDVPAADLIDRLFLLAKKIAGEQGTIVVRLEIPSAYIDPQLMTHILDRAQTHYSPVLPQLTIVALEALTPWMKSENFRQILLVSDRHNMSIDVESTTNNIINFLNHQVPPSWKCHIDDMTSEQLEAMLSIFERVRQKYPFFSLHLVSNRIDAAVGDNRVTINGASLPFISEDNEAVLNSLTSFIWMPQRINYKPFFAPRAHKLTCDLYSKRVTYESATGAETIADLEHIEACFDEAEAQPAVNPEATRALIENRLSCKYALVCGSNCGIRESPDADGRECGQMYERRLQQVLPLLFFNLQKRHQAAAGSTSG